MASQCFYCNNKYGQYYPGVLDLKHGEELAPEAYKLISESAVRYRAARAFGTPQGRAELYALASGVAAGLIFLSLRLGAAGYVVMEVSETTIFWLYIIVGILGAFSPIASYLAGRWLSK